MRYVFLRIHNLRLSNYVKDVFDDFLSNSALKLRIQDELYVLSKIILIKFSNGVTAFLVPV